MTDIWRRWYVCPFCPTRRAGRYRTQAELRRHVGALHPGRLPA